MLNNATGLSKIVLVTGYTDLRRGIDGLAALIKSEYGRDPFEKDVLYTAFRANVLFSVFQCPVFQCDHSLTSSCGFRNCSSSMKKS